MKHIFCILWMQLLFFGPVMTFAGIENASQVHFDEAHGKRGEGHDDFDANEILFEKKYLTDLGLWALIGVESAVTILRIFQNISCIDVPDEPRVIASGAVMTSVLNYVLTPFYTPIVQKYNIYYLNIIPLALMGIWDELTWGSSVSFGHNFAFNYLYDDYLEDGGDKRTFANFWSNNSIILSGVISFFACHYKSSMNPLSKLENSILVNFFGK